MSRLCLAVDVENTLPLFDVNTGIFCSNLEAEAKEDPRCNGNRDEFPSRSLEVQDDMSCRLLGIDIISK